MSEQESMEVVVNRMAAELAVIAVHARETRTEVAALTHQVKYLSQLTEDVIMEDKTMDASKSDALTSAYDFLEQSPMAKHPMFKEMMGPLQEMIKKQKA